MLYSFPNSERTEDPKLYDAFGTRYRLYYGAARACPFQQLVTSPPVRTDQEERSYGY